MKMKQMISVLALISFWSIASAQSNDLKNKVQ